MIADLESQLQFVRAIQEVDTEGVEPLTGIRDETLEGEKGMEIGVEELRGEFEKEEVVGKRGRIRRKVKYEGRGLDGSKGYRGEEGTVEGWDPVKQAGRKMGRFIVVETGKD